MNSKLFGGLLALGLVGAVSAWILFGKGMWFGREAGPALTEKQAADPYFQSLEEDKTVLEAFRGNPASVPELKVYGAMVRLAEISWPRAKEMALEHSKSDSKILRESSAQALAHFSDSDSDRALESLLRDKESSVRELALRSLGHKPTESRKKLLRDNRPQGAEASELVAWQEGQIKADGRRGAENPGLRELLQMAKGPEQDSAEKATIKLIEMAPYWEETILVARTRISGQSSPGMKAAGIRFLAGRQDPWLAPRWKSLGSSEEATVRKAVIQSLHRSCPPDRKELMIKFAATESDPTVQEVLLQATELMAEPWETEIFDRLGQSIKGDLLKEKLNKARESSRNRGESRRSPCLHLKEEAKTAQSHPVHSEDGN